MTPTEAQDIADAVLDAEVRMGQLTAAIPTATKGNQYTGKMVCNSVETNQKPKEEQLSDIGLTRQQANRFETLAKHPEAVEKTSVRNLTKVSTLKRSPQREHQQSASDCGDTP